MLENVTESLTAIIKKVRGQARLTEANITETADQLRDVLVDADVALDVADDFIAKVKKRALGQEVLGQLSPAEAFIGVVQKELTELFGNRAEQLAFPHAPPCSFLVAGLQGVGKTTSAAKIALFLRERKHRVLVVSTDVRRPAAIEQLRQLCEQAKVDYFEPEDKETTPIRRAEMALEKAKQQLHDYVVIDSAGRNSADQELMAEIEELAKITLPAETLLVLDATQGQEALATAKAFGDVLSLTGIIMTKLDGDARGGATLTARATLGIPVKMIGVGEKLDALEQFHPDRMASRILGMGDIASLVEKVSKHANTRKAADLARKLKRKRSPGLSLGDLIDQMRSAETMGGIAGMIDKLPAAAGAAVRNFNENPKAFKHMEAIYLSMSPEERKSPQILKATRKQRIANGCGLEVHQVNQLLQQHSQANKLMKRAAKNPKAMMQMLRGLATGGR